MNISTCTIRTDTKARKEFDKAFSDLRNLLPLYSEVEHTRVITGYLGSYGLLVGKDSAKGRLIDKLGKV
jgi:hypothetical protein